MNEENEDIEVDEIIYSLIQAGALELTSMDKDGDPIYRITEKCKDLFPDLYYEHMKETDDITFSLWQKNLVEINFSDDTNYIRMTPENYLNYLNVKEELTEEEESVLFILINKNILDNDTPI